MPIKKWIVQYLIMLAMVFVILALVQYLKGRGLAYATEFGILWSFITSTIFLGTRMYKYRKHTYCALCNDIPAPADKNKN
jgi:hypothetical protein